MHPPRTRQHCFCPNCKVQLPQAQYPGGNFPPRASWKPNIWMIHWFCYTKTTERCSTAKWSVASKELLLEGFYLFRRLMHFEQWYLFARELWVATLVQMFGGRWANRLKLILASKGLGCTNRGYTLQMVSFSYAEKNYLLVSLAEEGWTRKLYRMHDFLFKPWEHCRLPIQTSDELNFLQVRTHPSHEFC